VLFSQDQRFTCAQCGRCCRRTTVPLTAGEAEAYRNAGAARWFSENDDVYDGGRDPFEPILGFAPLLRIRKRPDGACGFLSPEGLCRIHQMMGADRKPIACRLFPFRFHPADDTVVTASFACPTVIANEGAPLPSQARELRVLHAGWMREHPEPAAQVELVSGYALSGPVLAALRGILRGLIDRPGPDGRPDLRENLRRIAAFLEDLSRPRARRLAPDAFAEYVEVMGGHALTNQKPAATRPGSRLARLLFRGFLLAALSVQVRLDAGVDQNGFRLRATLLRLLAHLHGLAAGTPRFDLGRATEMPFRLNDNAVLAVAHRYLCVSFETLGTGRRPLVDEVAMIVAHLNAACVLAGMHAAASRKSAVDGESFVRGLLESADLAHADDGRRLSTFLTALSGGVEALYLFPPMYSYDHG
jgi:Fe-S-cluster containining protein